MQTLLKYGITSFMDAAVKQPYIEYYNELYSSSDVDLLPRCALSIVLKSIPFDPEYCPEEDGQVSNSLSILNNFFKKYRIDHWNKHDSFKLKVNSVKLFIDGVFESGTAMFKSKNCCCDEEIKSYTYTEEELDLIVNSLCDQEIQLHTHCIGDLATKLILNSYEKRFNIKGMVNKEKNYIAHLQLVDKEDIERMKRLEVTGNFSPYWFMEDSFTTTYLNLVGEERLNDTYPIKTLKDNGVRVCFGSDWPVSMLNPLDGIEVAVTHRGLRINDEMPVFNPEQRLDVYEAVEAYTLGSAEVLGLDEYVGTLEVGKFADLIVLDKNIFEIKPSDISSSKVILTMINGKIVYEEK